VRLIHQAVEDRVGERLIADRDMPVLDRQLTGDDRRARTVAVVEDLQEVATALVGQWRQPPLVDDQDLGLGDLRQGLEVTAIAAANGQGRQESGQTHITHGVTLSARLVGERAGKKGLADAHRTAEQDVLVRAHSAGHQTSEQRSVETARMPIVDILWRGGLLESGPLQTGGVLPRLTVRGLAVDEQAEALIERQLADVRGLRLAGQGTGHAGETQLVEFIDGRMVEHGKSRSVVVIGATQIGVFDGQTGLGRGADDALLVQTVLQDRFQAAVGRGADGDGPFASGFQAIVAVGLGEAQDAQARPVTLLRMSALVQKALYDRAGMRPDARGPVEQAWCIPAEDRLMARGHVRIEGGVPTAGVVPGMAGDAHAAVKQFDGRRRQPTVDRLPGKAVGHRVDRYGGNRLH